MVGSYGVILSCYLKQFSFSRTFCLSWPCPSLLMCDFACLSFEISIKFFSPFFLDTAILSIIVLSVSFLITLITLFAAQFYVVFDASTLSWMLSSPLPALFFYTYNRSMSFLGRRPSAGSSLFLLSDPYADVLPSSTSRMVLSILQEGQIWYLSPWWEIFIIWFPVGLSFSLVTLFLMFFFHRHLFNNNRFQFSQVLVSSLFSERSDFVLIC